MMRIFFCFIACYCCTITSNCQSWKQYLDSAILYKDNAVKSIHYLNSAKQVFPLDGDQGALIDINKNLVEAYFKRGQYDEAETMLNENVALIHRLQWKNEDIYGHTLYQLGITFYFENDSQKSEYYLLEAKKFWERLQKTQGPEYAKNANALGALYDRNGRYTEALKMHLLARQIRQTLGKESVDYAQSLNNLAALYWKLGELEKAEPLAKEALDIRGRVLGNESLPYAISCVNLGNIYRDMGQYEKSEVLYLEAKNIREKNNRQDLYAESCNILADLYSYMGRFDQAEKLYLEAKAIRSSKKDKAYAETLNNLAALYQANGETKKAENFSLEAFSIYKNVLGRDDPSIAIGYNNLGKLYLSLGQYARAEPYFLQARKRWLDVLDKSHPFLTSNTISLAQLKWNLSQSKESIKFYQQAAAGQFEQLSKIFAFTSEKEKENYLEKTSNFVEEFQSFCYLNKYPGPLYDLSLTYHNLILNASQRLRILVNTFGDSTAKAKYELWTEIKKDLGSLYSQADVAPEKIKILEDRTDQLEKDLTRQFSSIKNSTAKEAKTWKQVQQKLSEKEASIEFTTFNLFDGKRWTDSVYYVALVIRKDRIEPQAVYLCEESQLLKLLSATRNETSNDNVGALYSRGIDVDEEKSALDSNLYQLIWKPVEKSLEGVSTIYFSPAGLLHKIAFAAIPLTADSVLSDKYRLNQLSTTGFIESKDIPIVKTGDEIVLYGGIHYSSDTTQLKNEALKFASNKIGVTSESAVGFHDEKIWPDLIGTQTEIDNINRQAGEKYHVIRFSGNKATEESFKSLSSSSSPSILHLATHGFFFPDPKIGKSESGKKSSNGKIIQQSKNPLLRSGLLLSGANYTWQNRPVPGIEDGILTAFEISNLFLPKTKLAVLSACETALGDIQGAEGVYGLQRAFKMAGVENLIMSLWKVPDVETAEFMELLYSGILKEKTITESFHSAQTAMKNKYRADARKWAAWILTK